MSLKTKKTETGNWETGGIEVILVQIELISFANFLAKQLLNLFNDFRRRHPLLPFSTIHLLKLHLQDKPGYRFAQHQGLEARAPSGWLEVSRDLG